MEYSFEMLRRDWHMLLLLALACIMAAMMMVYSAEYLRVGFADPEAGRPIALETDRYDVSLLPEYYMDDREPRIHIRNV